jgi:hypothetical protein
MENTSQTPLNEIEMVELSTQQLLADNQITIADVSSTSNKRARLPDSSLAGAAQRQQTIRNFLVS